jgi:hypothetical protein
MQFHGTTFEQVQTAFNKWKDSVPAYCSRNLGSKGILETSTLPHQLNLNITYSICLEMLERRLNIKSDTFSEMVKSLRRTTDRPQCHSPFGSAAFPPAFYLAVHLSSGITGLLEVKETIQRLSLQANSSPRDCRPDGDEIAGGVIPNDSTDDLYPVANAHIPKSLTGGNYVTSTGESRYDTQNNHAMIKSYEDIEMVNGRNLQRSGDLNTLGGLATNRANWHSRTDSRPPMAARISMSDQRIAQEGLANNPTWDRNAFSAAGNLFHSSQSSRIEQENQMGRSNSTGMGNHQTGFSIPYAETIGIPEAGMDPVLQGMTSADDLFFDLLNLEQL